LLASASLADPGLDGRAARIALAALAAGARVELVGSVRDDAAGDEVVVRLGRAGIGHAAVLRDPAADGPRLDAGDLGLGLSYLADCRVIVAAETLDADAMAAVVNASDYHGAVLVVVAEPGAGVDVGTADNATVLEAPEGEPDAFDVMVGRFAAGLDRGVPAGEAFRSAWDGGGWLPVGP
jgi:hypothetical protein